MHDGPRWAEFLDAVDVSPENLARYTLDIPVPEELLAIEGACDILRYKREQYCD